jgi:DNA-binding winged helix-turn-helix (wHTH) protein
MLISENVEYSTHGTKLRAKLTNGGGYTIGYTAEILRYLVDNPDRLISGKELMTVCWPEGTIIDEFLYNTLRVHITRLRSFLRDNFAEESLLTLHGSDSGHSFGAFYFLTHKLY